MEYRRKGDDGFRQSENNDYYHRGRSPSPRDRFRHEDSRRRDDDYRDGGFPRGAGGHHYERKPRSPERYSSSWRRNSVDRSPRGRSRSRSRSSSQGRARYHGGRSPRRRSSRRSSSYGSRKRFRRGSSTSSSSSSSEDQRSRSPTGGTKQEPNEDFFQSMYYKKEAEKLQPGAYLHPALNRSVGDAPPVKGTHPPAMQTTENITAHAVSNTASFNALSQAYGASPPKQTYTQQEIDDEDRFLYGDDSAGTQVQKPANHNSRNAPVQPPPPQPPPERSVEAQKNVTPGGFDSNALKNVLKAIGFDFEMSAQQSQPMNNPAPQPPVKSVPPPQPQPRPAPPPVTEPPQQIQTIQSIHATQPVQPAPPKPTQPQHAPLQHAPVQQYYQPYNPYQQPHTVTYPPHPVQAPLQTQSSGLQYPITLQDPNNPGGNLLVYQPVNPTSQPQVVYQHQTAAPPPLPVVQQPQPPSGRVVLPPQRQDVVVVPEVKKSENEIRLERLNYLQAELEKLKKQQNELLRKKRREKDGHKDPLIKKNNLLQAGVEEQIREIRQAAEIAAGIASDGSDHDNEEKSEQEDKYDYFDGGNHWCRLCNTVSADLGAFLSHLHSKSHRKAVDPYDRPWDEGEQTNKKKTSDRDSKALKGSEFLIPVTGYYCTLCQTFSGDQICAEDHCKSYLHNTIYKKHCKKNPSYEKKYKKKKRAAMESVGNGEKKKELKQAPVKTAEIKYVVQPVKVVKEEPKYVENPLKYIVPEPRYVEKPTPTPKYVAEEIKFATSAPSYPEKDPYEPEKKKEKKRKVSKERTQEKHQDKGRDERRDITGRNYERNEKQAYQEKAPKKYEENFDQLRSADHGKRRKQHWSPGYDEYERQQQDERRDKRRSREKHDRRSRSRERDRGERWVERSPQDDRKKGHRSKDRKESVAAGAKIPTPGFGKFAWNSGAPNDAASFDQVPCDTLVSSRDGDDKNGEFSSKGKIAIKITGKTHYPPRLSTSSVLSSKSNASHPASDVVTQEKRAAMAIELQKKVEALKRENALRAQLSSITLPSGRTVKQIQSKPNTAAVMLGARSIGRHNTLLMGKMQSRSMQPVASIKLASRKEEEEIITQEIEADVSPPPPPEDKRQPPPPGEYEPPPPGEEDIAFGDIDDGVNSDASGISMELASDEE